MVPIRIVTIVLAALALAFWPRGLAFAETVLDTPAVVRTPEPYRPAATPGPVSWQVPLPIRAAEPMATARTPEPLHRPAPAASPGANTGGTTQVINLVMPELGASRSDGDVVVRLDTAPGSSRVELRVRHEGEGGAGPQAPAYRPPPGPASAGPTPEPFRTPPPRRPTRTEAVVTPVLAVPLISELFSAGGLDVPFAPVPRLGLEGQLDLDGDWALEAAASFARYTLVDQQYAPSRHARQELTGHATGWRTVAPGAKLGLGYWGRYVGVTQSVPPPLTTPLVTSPSQAFHGPQLSARADWPLPAPWSLSGQLDARPYMFATGDEAVTPLSPGWGFGVAAELGYRLDERLTAGLTLSYNRQGAYSAGFVRSELGPAARLSWRF